MAEGTNREAGAEFRSRPATAFRHPPRSEGRVDGIGSLARETKEQPVRHGYREPAGQGGNGGKR